MEMAQDIEQLKVSFPCLLTVQKDIVQPRLPSYKLKKETEKREITMYTLNDMDDTDKKHYGLSGSATQVQRIFPPVSNKEQETWEGAGAELATKLHDKLKQLKFIS